MLDKHVKLMPDPMTGYWMLGDERYEYAVSEYTEEIDVERLSPEHLAALTWAYLPEEVMHRIDAVKKLIQGRSGDMHAGAAVATKIKKRLKLCTPSAKVTVRAAFHELIAVTLAAADDSERIDVWTLDVHNASEQCVPVAKELSRLWGAVFCETDATLDIDAGPLETRGRPVISRYPAQCFIPGIGVYI
jgi:hypothetical protein